MLKIMTLYIREHKNTFMTLRQKVQTREEKIVNSTTAKLKFILLIQNNWGKIFLFF